MGVAMSVGMRNISGHVGWFVARFILFVTVVAGLGCATPRPLVGLEPRNPAQVIWVDGRAALEKQEGGVRVATAFEAQRGDLLGLRVEIENGTGAPFEVGPDDITYMTCAERDNETCDGSFEIVDPEAALMALDEADSREKASATNDAAFLGTLTILSAVTDVASIASRRTDDATVLRTASLAGSMADTEARHERQRGTFATERQLWSDYALRRNTLVPGRGTSGLIYLPTNLKAQYVWIHVRAGGHTFPFGFQQTVTKVVYGHANGTRVRQSTD